jgi:hypothetical protein
MDELNRFKLITLSIDFFVSVKSTQEFADEPKILYELFGKQDIILYLCGEITHTIPIPLL